MRIFAIQPGASNSTSDVYNGLVAGLRELGHEILIYQLDAKIARAGAWLDFCYKKAKERDPNITEPTTGDVLFQACGMSIPVCLFKKPDWVIVVSSMYYPKLFLKMLKACRQKLAVLLTESPYDDDDQYGIAAIADVVWTNERTSVEKIRVANSHTSYLPHAYDPARHCPVNGDAPEVAKHDVVFVGTGFQERIELLESIDWTGIDFGLYGTWELGGNSKLRQYQRADEISNDAAAALYRNAKIGLNLHRTSKGFGLGAPKIEHAESLNPRA